MPLIRQRDFRFFWAAQTASTFGAHMSRVSLPLLAATTLAATPFQMGLLQAAQTIAFLVIGLLGALVDRVRRRPILIACDALRALLLLCLVVGFALDRVDFTGLMTATLAIGFATAFYEIAYQSYIPAVVGRARLVEGNARLESTNAVARLSPALGGSLVQLLGATLTVASQLVGHLVSALLVTRIRTVEERPPRGERLRMAAEIGGGLRFVLGLKPVFRAITGSAATYNFFYAVMLPLMMLLLVEELGLSGAAVGALMAVAGLGGIVGAASAGLARRFGQVRVVWLSYLVTVPTTLLMPLTHGGWGARAVRRPLVHRQLRHRRLQRRPGQHPAGSVPAGPDGADERRRTVHRLGHPRSRLAHRRRPSASGSGCAAACSSRVRG